MKKLCIVFRRAPHGTAHGREGLDLALLSASFEQEVSLLFMDEGVLNLLKQQQPELIGAKDYIATFKALPLYDVETVLVCKQSLAELGLSTGLLSIPVTVFNHEQIAGHLAQADEVLVF
ncbi:sulfurtransferase complex subunit TusC [Shewanella sp. AS16]|uniref:sulfurtransferase complex subunit TusC n=1 Tax=Shewanella sp. AS16 TaxID=2907625 RepID=UPI001F1D886A|nr:sulfurtransferase complex subunit TusC [Shewanella sp. AS16]MCE9687319.1 sulfurtransferase complex subunit TusC [Shewanella sp. AS16]